MADIAMLLLLGYCNGSNSFANGSGLANSSAGSTSSFSVFLLDHYRIPSPVETARMQVKILGKNATSYADPIITPGRESNGNVICSFSGLAFY
jgi:hypothetical protein